MSWRTVVITNKAKLSYKNNYMLIRKDELTMIHLSEINTILVDSTQVSITSALLCELVKRKIKVVFCDEARNPISEIVPYYGSHNSSKKISKQIIWNESFKQGAWTLIVGRKILNQANFLKKVGKEEHLILERYYDEMEDLDITNREGHAAKVYFNCLFGKDFSRDENNNINAALNYGYTILLSTFNKEIVSNGYLTQLGINHKNEFNYFNLSSDLMEPFRPLVDEFVYEKKEDIFDVDYKMGLVGILNKKIRLGDKEYYVSNAISVYVKSVVDAIENQSFEKMHLYEFL